MSPNSQHTIAQPQPLPSSIMVAIDARGQGEALIRSGKRVAERQRAAWTVVTVDTGQLDQVTRERLDGLLNMAGRLGAEIKTLRGYDVADELLSFARDQNITTMIVGHTGRRRWIWRRSTSQRLLKQGTGFDVMFVPVPRKARQARVCRRGLPTPPRHYLWALASVALATVAALFLQHLLPLGNLSLVFLTGVLWVAANTGIRPALVTALISFLTYNFLFTEPRLTFHMVRTDELITVVFFLLIAVIGGQLAGRLRQQILMLRATNDQTEAILKFTKRLAAAPNLPAVYREAVDALADRLQTSVVLLEPNPDTDSMVISAAAGTERALSHSLLMAAKWTFGNGRASGYHAETSSALPWRFEPLGETDRPRAVLGLALGEASVDNFSGATLDAYVHQLSLALVRTELAASLSASRIAEETESLRSALLSSVSHDLRTPLASMIGSASTLRSLHGKLSETDRDSLLDAILNEGQRLDRYIRNLLDMTKLGHGSLKIEREWIAVTDILASALRRTRALLENVRVERQIPDTLPLLFVHPALIEQALVNVLENAARFAPPHSTISIEATQVGDEMHLAVSDEGPGIPEAQRCRVFELFFTGNDGDRGAHGSGLGLAICKGMISAHGGRIEVQARAQGTGALIHIALPLREAPEEHQEMA